MIPGLDLYCVDAAQHLTTVGEDLDTVDRNLSYVFFWNADTTTENTRRAA